MSGNTNKIDIKKLETEYLRAKVEYYEGSPIMSDNAFDFLEKILKDCNSKVLEQVGTKRKDFDFAHPSRMRSLAKLQTEELPDGIDYKTVELTKWYNKNATIIKNKPGLLASPKFDGNAINIVYRVGIEDRVLLSQVTTRGDGNTGKDITTRFKSKLPKELKLLCLKVKSGDVIEIRAEVVILLSIFNEKYKGTKEEGKFANARNYVAGVLGKDDFDYDKVSELDILPVHYLVNGNQVDQDHFRSNSFSSENYDIHFSIDKYENVINQFIELRKTHKYLLDGIVIAFPVPYRKQLGENDHDPEWSIAIKFVPEETITGYNGIEWNVSKRGELTPVILLNPVQLAGTTVKRASGYNAGYIVNNKIGPGSYVSIIKAGDIIPEVQKVTIESIKPIELPTHCPSCQTELDFDNIHLQCQNEKCAGRISKKLSSAAIALKIKGIGPKTLEPFAADFMNMYELMKWSLTLGNTKEIEQYGIEYQSRSHEIFVNAFTKIKSLPYDKVIIMLGYDNVGKSLSKQLAIEHAGLEPNYESLEKALIAKLHEPEVETYIKTAVSDLESLGIVIDRPQDKKESVSNDSIGICLTGSPKTFGYTTKQEFLDKFPYMYETKLNDPNCKFLVTDNLESTSSKMKTAKKKGIEIVLYKHF